MLIDVPEELGEKLLKENPEVKELNNLELYNLFSDKYFIERLYEYSIDEDYEDISPEEYNYCLSKLGDIWDEVSMEMYCATNILIERYIDKFNDF